MARPLTTARIARGAFPLLRLGLCVAGTACGGSTADGEARAVNVGGTSGTGAANTDGVPMGTAAGGRDGSSNGGTRANDGEATAGGTSSTSVGSTSSGTPATGGNAALGGASVTGAGSDALGGASSSTGKALGGTTSGSTVAGGGTALGGSTGCTAPRLTSCTADKDCHSAEYCDTSTCDSMCSCESGQQVCPAACRFICKPGTCKAPTSSFVKAVHDAGPCNVVVRVNETASEILGYRIVSGEWKTNPLQSIEDSLAAWASIRWSRATRYQDSIERAYLYLYPPDENDRYAWIAFSGATGEELFRYVSWSGPDIADTWLPASDLNSSCNGVSGRYVRPLGPWDFDNYLGDAVLDLLHRRGFFAGIAAAMGNDWGYGGCSDYLILRTPSVPIEYIVIASPSPCV